MPPVSNNFTVTESTDNGLGNTEGTLSWAILQANQLAGDDTITLNNDVRVTGVVKTLVNSNISIVGNNHTLSGDANNNGINDNGDVRPLFILSGTVGISDLTITNGRAKGGNGSGGGAGMGGGLFIYDGNVSLTNVAFSNNAAQGGSGSFTTSGGGGMFGNGSNSGSYGRGGGGGLFGNASGSNGGYGGNGNYGGGNGGFGGGGNSGFGYLGGGGNGGFGGGGGGAVGDGGFGGFGGGAGYSGSNSNGGYSPAGSFGGRGGLISSYLGDNTGVPGGGYGGGGAGGGGAGLGGGIFVRSGSLTLSNTSFSNNTATGGAAFQNGQGVGGAIFIMQSLTNSNGNNQGMPTVIGTIDFVGSSTFSGNSAANDAGTPTNNDDVYGTEIPVSTTTVSIITQTATANEGGSNGVFRLTRSDTTGDLIINLTIDGISTASTADYTLSGGSVAVSGNTLTVTIADGQSFVDLDLTAVDDIATEADETLKLNLATGIGYTIGSTNNTATVTIPANDEVQNSPPTAVDDDATTNEDTTLSGNVIANDTDQDTGDILTVSAVNGSTANVGIEIALTSGALLTQNANGSFDYNPNGQFESLAVGATATDSFNYTISDGNGGTDTATVNITINGVNDAPTGSPTATLGNTAEDTAIIITAANLLAGFSDVDTGDTLSVANLTATNGALVNNNNGTYTFTPTANFNGAVNLTYGVTDGTDTLAGQTQTFSVTAVNDAPTVTGETITTSQNTGNPVVNVTVDVGDNLFDPDANGLAGATLAVTSTSNGTIASIDQTARLITFTPTAGFSGAASFNYTLTDAGGLTSNVATVSVNVGSILSTGNKGQDVEGTSGDDYIAGGNGKDTLRGRAGRDTLLGNNGNDILYGEGGNDILDGGNGTDILYGGLGNDRLTGGNGPDTFVFAAGEGTDTITDFSSSNDKIGLSGGLSFGALSFSGNNILFGSEVLATLTDVNTTTLTQSNFVTI